MLYFILSLWFLQFLSHFLLLKLISFDIKLGVKRAGFLASKCTSLLLRSKPIQQNYWHFLKDFKLKRALSGIMKERLLVKMLLMEIILGPKVTMNQVATRKPCFGYLCRFVTRALTLRLRNTYTHVF